MTVAVAIIAAASAPTARINPAAAPPTTLRLWPGSAPGTADWAGQQVELDADLPAGKVHIISNVTVPTLTVVRPPAGASNGLAMIVVPGGAFRALAWDLEGIEVAQWLAGHGVTAFVLKYRVRPPQAAGNGPPERFGDFLRRTAAARQVATADTAQAMRIVRSNARRYGVEADRVGVIGFSAGAIATMALVLSPSAATRPDFAVIAYGALPGAATPAPGAPPLFIVAAQDDPQVPPAESVNIWQRWNAAHRSAELHLVQSGGHGFGMRKLGRATDGWPVSLAAWMTTLKRPLVKRP